MPDIKDQSNLVIGRNCGYCGGRINCRQDALLLHVDRCERQKIREMMKAKEKK